MVKRLLSRNGAVASLNALQLTPLLFYFSLLLLYRYYDKRYQAFFGNAFHKTRLSGMKKECI